MKAGKPGELPFHAVIGLGIALATFQFALNRSLWLDEAMLSLNILDRGFAGLMHPLAYDQAAPIGFLLAERMAVVLLGGSEAALRLFPFLCFLLSVPLTYILAMRLTERKSAALLSVALFVMTLSVIGYASEVKQYMADVFFALLIPVLALRHEPGRRYSFRLLALGGSLAVCMSNAAVIPLAVSGAYLAGDVLLRRKDFRILWVFLAWGATFAGYYAAFIHGHPGKALMSAYWADSFLPLNPLSKSFYGFLFHALRNVCRQLFGFYAYWQAAEAFVLIGLVCLALRRRFKTLFFLIAPIALHFLLSGLKLYPFTGRFLLYAVPLFAIMAAITTACICTFLKARFPRAPEALMLLPVLAMLPPLYFGYPVYKEEIKDNLVHLRSDLGGDSVLVYYSSLPAADYYRKTGVMDTRIPIIRGEAHRDTLSAYDTQLDSLRGTVWLLFSHVYPFRAEGNEETYMLEHLRGRGAQVLDSARSVGSSLYRVATMRSPEAAVEKDSAGAAAADSAGSHAP